MIIKKPIYDYFWKTAEGNIINVQEMEESHLSNSLNFLERKLHDENGNWDREKILESIYILNTELKRRENGGVF